MAPQPDAVPGVATRLDRKCCDVHCNTLWSLWYGILVVLLQAFIVYQCVQRFLLYIALPWPDGSQPYAELNVFVGLVGAGVVLMPFFLVAFLFKVGNLANDGVKLGVHMSSCVMDPPTVLARSSGIVRNIWHHGGPTAPFIHLVSSPPLCSAGKCGKTAFCIRNSAHFFPQVSSFCFILPKMFIEAKLIDVGFLSRGKNGDDDDRTLERASTERERGEIARSC